MFRTIDPEEVAKKKPNAPVALEEALNITGSGWFSWIVMFSTGLVQFSGVLGLQAMAFIIPVAGCDLKLTGFQKGTLNSVPFSGMMFSSLVFGSLADRFGRRTVIIFSCASTMVLSIIASIAPTYVILSIVWFANGFLLGGLISPSFVLVSEFVPQRIRAMSVLMAGCLGSLASLYLAGMAWVVLPLDISIAISGQFVFSSWRLYLALLAVPTVLTTFLIYRLPESPKFTLNLGDGEVTMRTLRTIYSINHKKAETDCPISSVCLDESDKLSVPTSTEPSGFLVGMVGVMTEQYVSLFTPPLIFYTALSCAILGATIGLSNTLFLWLPELMSILMEYSSDHPDYSATLCEIVTGINGTESKEDDPTCQLNSNIFFISTITAALQSFVLVVASLVANVVGKKLILVTFSTVSLISCLVMVLVTQFQLTVIFMGLAIVVLCATFPIGFSIIVDFFPTSLRSSATSITMLFGRLGASIGSQLYGSLFQNHCDQLYWGIIAIMACDIIVFILMPSKRKP